MAWCLLEPILGKELNQVLVVDVVALLEAVMGSDNFTKSTTVWGGGSSLVIRVQSWVFPVWSLVRGLLLRNAPGISKSNDIKGTAREVGSVSEVTSTKLRCVESEVPA